MGSEVGCIDVAAMPVRPLNLVPGFNRHLKTNAFPPWSKPHECIGSRTARTITQRWHGYATPFRAKIANAERLRAHTMLVIGGRHMEAGAVSVRLHHGGPKGAKPKTDVIADILASIREWRA